MKEKLIWSGGSLADCRSFDRSDIRSAKIVQRGIEKAIEFVLTDGTHLQFSQFGTGYSRLRTYLGLDGSE